MILNKEKIKKSIKQTARSLWNVFPSILATVFLISLLSALIPKTFYSDILTKNTWLDLFIADFAGSLSAGNPMVSYIIGNEMLNQGILLIVVMVFIISWVTVGIIQLPAESVILGKKFAIVRNITAFILAIVSAFAVVFLVNYI